MRKPSSRSTRFMAVLACIAIVMTACSGDEPVAPSPAASSPTPVTSAFPGGETPPLLPDSPTELPEFTPADFQTLVDQMDGTPVVVNIWASWCGPCTEEAPVLSVMAKRFAGRIQFIGVDIQDQVIPARAFIDQYGWTYPSVFDPTGAIRDDLGLLGQPVTILLNQVGREIWRVSGPVDANDLERTLNAVLEV